MMMRKIFGAGLALLIGGAPCLWAQIPGAPAAPAVPAPPPLAPPPPVAAPAAPSNIFSFFMPTADQKAAFAACKLKFCASPIGTMLNNSLAPISAFTGGLISSCCPPFNPADLQQPPGSPEGAAARIKADEAGAKARIANVKYLAHADCHYWPEASLALVNALRADRNECVRLAAAQALGTGCCCNKMTIVALSISAAGSDRDGNPSEKSERVRMAAQMSLANCLGRCEVPVPAPGAPVDGGGTGGGRERPPEPIKPMSATEPAGRGTVEPAAYYKRVEAMSRTDAVEFARQSVASWAQPAAVGQPGVDAGGGVAVAQGSAAGDHSLFGLVASAVGPVKDSLRPPGHRPAGSVFVARTGEVSGVEGGDQPPALAGQTSPASPYQSNPTQPVGFQAPAAPANPVIPEPATSKPLPVGEPSAPAVHSIPANVPPASGAAKSPGASLTPHAPKYFPPANGMDVGKLLNTLRDGARPQDRAWAAAELATLDAGSHPNILEGLLAAGRLDTVAAVRVQCIRSLAKMNVSTMAVIEMLESLQNDADLAVQQEARQALAKLSGR